MSGHDDNSESEARRILLVDDHPLMRLVMRNMLEEQADLTICGESSGGNEAVELFKASEPDLVLLDFFLKDTDAIELIMVFKKLKRRVPVLIFSRIEDSLLAERATRAGADGFMVKSEVPEQVLEGIRQTLAGGQYFSPSVARSVVSRKLHPDRFLSDPRFVKLTETEQLILRLLGQGSDLDQIAMELRTDVAGIEAVNVKICRKLELRSFQELALLAVRHFGAIYGARRGGDERVRED